MLARRARLYDIIALLTAIIVVVLDQWTKSLVVDHLGPPDQGPVVPLIDPYLVLYYIRNKGVAFSMFNANGPLLLILVGVALAVIVYLYVRMLNKGSLLFKLVFGLIIGGAVGNNLLDRLIRGSVVDFIFFRIPQINFNFAVFNIADAAISVGVALLFVSLVISTVRTRSGEPDANPLLQSQHIQEHDV